MRRALVALALLLAPAIAHAQLYPVLGVGFAHASPRHDGTWWQRAFPHTLALNHPSVLVGLDYDAGEHWDAQAALIWLGHFSSDARAIPNDPAYDTATDTCVGPCLPRAHYIGHGWIGAAKLTVGWHTRGPWRVGFHAGPIYYRYSWRLYVPDWYTAVQQPDGTWRVKYRTPIRTSDLRWTFGYTVGMAIRRGRWGLTLDLYRDGASFPGHNGLWPPGWRRHIVLGIEYAFAPPRP